MTPRITLAIAARLLAQLRRDHRTLAMMLVVPCVLLTLLWWMFYDQPQIFDRFGPPTLVLFPFVVMFLVTSVTTLRERSTGTLERLLAMPMGRGDLLVGYALAFALVSVAQGALLVALAVGLLDMDIAGPTWVLGLVVVLDAILGAALGLFVSAFAATEFQAVQFMPAVVIPQFLLCGLLIDREQLPAALTAISDVLPLSYAVDAVQEVQQQATVTSTLLGQLAIVLAFGVAGLAVGSITLRRRTA